MEGQDRPRSEGIRHVKEEDWIKKNLYFSSHFKASFSKRFYKNIRKYISIIFFFCKWLILQNIPCQKFAGLGTTILHAFGNGKSFLDISELSVEKRNANGIFSCRFPRFSPFVSVWSLRISDFLTALTSTSNGGMNSK